MAERTLISWNVPNWITVILMASAGYALLVGVQQFLARWGPRGAAANAASLPPSPSGAQTAPPVIEINVE